MQEALRSRLRRAMICGLSESSRIAGAYKRALSQSGLEILLFHHTPPSAVRKLESFVTSHLEQQVGYAKAVRDLEFGHVPANLAITISFDDGFKSNLQAARLLSSLGISACFFISTGVIGASQAEVDRFFGWRQPEGVMNWDDVVQLIDLGHVVGSHSHFHTALSTMSRTEWHDQLGYSFELLSSRVGRIEHFAWPFGSLQSAPVKEVVQFCGEQGIIVASGVRGRNRPYRLASEGFLRRESIDPRWLTDEVRAFLSLSAALPFRRSRV